ncbi:rhomboid family intramembrane serine protease [Nocardioides aurantiacus]|uniref:rhomboid family intramembrane serine protease n=1 Tax=Nocardioides aurantiacus TaxID=86796 RepID=UPI00403F33F5
MTQGGPEAPPTCYRHPDRETWIRCQRCDRPICPDCMRSAAVGFQCPECVAEGAKSTRQLRTPYGGTRVDDPRLTSFVLIGLNVAVFLAVLATGGRSSRLTDYLALLPQSAAKQYGDGSVELVRGVSDGAVWEVLTSAFTHVQPLHIAFNMLALYFLGPTLESVLGRARYLALYLVSALSGSAVVMVLSGENTQTLGASGAVFGLMGALAVVALKVRGEAQQVLVWIAINLVITFALPSISWQGHLGGLVAGAAIGAAMVYAPKQRRALVQWGAVAAVALLAVVAIALRALALA